MEIPREIEMTMRFQLVYGLFMVIISLAIVWASNSIWTMDIRFAMFCLALLMAIMWFRDGLVMLSDVGIAVMKMRNRQ